MSLQSLGLGARSVSKDVNGGPQRVTPVRDAPVVARPFLAVMGIVALLAAIYYGLVAAPMYVSEARFSIRSQQAASPTSVLQGLAGGASNDKLTDITAVQDYINSQAMLYSLDQEFGLRRTYSQFRIDPLHWLSPNASEEKFLRFYRRMIVIKVDREAGIVEIDVRAFDKASAKPLAEAILKRTENFVDGMTQRVRSETMRSAQSELDRARAQTLAARAAVGAFRGATSSVNPSATGAQMQGGQGALEAQAASIQAELAGAMTFNRPDSPAVRQIRARLAAVQAQAARLRAEQGVGGQAGQVTAYEALLAQRDSAERVFASATTAFDSARALAQQQEKYVVRVVNPSQPDKPTEPNRIRDFLMVMVFAFAGYAIVSLAIAGVRDHRGV